MKAVRVAAILALMPLAGCVGAALEGANIARDEVIYRNHLAAAEAGDAEAQYAVGEALCCAPADADGPFYSTERAVDWLCRSATQGYAPAMTELAKIYSGDTVDGVRVLRRAAFLVGGTSTNQEVAYAWADRAYDAGELAAIDVIAAIDLDDDARARAEALSASERLSCAWDDVVAE